MTRKALVILVAAAGLAVAGGAGAVASGTVSIGVGDRVKLNGSHVMCFTGKTSKGRLSIECGLAAGNGFPAGAYSAYVNDTGVYVWENLGRGKYKKAAFYVNK